MYVLIILASINMLIYLNKFYITKEIVIIGYQFLPVIVVCSIIVILLAYLIKIDIKCNNIQSKLSNLFEYLEKSHDELIKSDKKLQHFLLEILNKKG